MTGRNVTKTAAVLQIEQNSRIESIVTFICTPGDAEGNVNKQSIIDSWCELVDLINDPASYMKAQQFLWSQVPESRYIEWEVLRPTAMSLKCGPQTIDRSLKTASAMQSNPAVSKLYDAVLKTNEESAFTTELSSAIQGTFHVEFATYTNFVTVLYYPPKFPMEDSTPWKYDGELDSKKVLYTSVGKEIGTMHSDIDSTARGRAKFFASFAHWPDYIYDRLETQTEIKDRFIEQTAVITPEGGAIEIPQHHRRGRNDHLPPNPGGKVVKVTFDRSKGVGDNSRPDIMLPNLSEVSASTRGCQTSCFLKNKKGDLILTTVNGVTYHSIGLQPEETFDAFLRKSKQTIRDLLDSE